MVLEKRWVLGGLLSVSAGFCVLYGLVYWILYHPGKELAGGEVVAFLVFVLLLGGFNMLIGGFGLKERD